MTWDEYRRKRQKTYEAYEHAKQLGEQAVNANDWRAMVEAGKLCDRTYLADLEVENLLLRGMVEFSTED
jgi:hypothetical protein